MLFFIMLTVEKHRLASLTLAEVSGWVLNSSVWLEPLATKFCLSRMQPETNMQLFGPVENKVLILRQKFRVFPSHVCSAGLNTTYDS